MDNRNSYRILAEFGIWAALYVLWIFIFQNRAITVTRTMGIEFCYLVFIAANYYFTVYYSVRRFLNKHSYFIFISVALLSTAVAGLFRAIVAYYISSVFNHINNIDAGRLYFNSVLNIFIWTECLVACRLVLDKLKQQRYTEAVEKEKVVNELNFLKAQHDPHFLFNSLNAIYFQIDKNNIDARGTLMKLSEMLRYQLYECNADTIPIEKEINYLKNYIELQKVRLNSNYHIQLNIADDMKGFNIAPLLIIPLVENAFKYISHFSHKQNKIEINLSKKKNTFTCVITNTIEMMPQIPSESEGGIGHKNLERRLELLYLNKHKFTYGAQDGRYNVTLHIEVA